MQSGWGGETAFSTVTENAQRHGRFHVRRPESAVVTYREPANNKIRWFQPQEEETESPTASPTEKASRSARQAQTAPTGLGRSAVFVNARLMRLGLILTLAAHRSAAYVPASVSQDECGNHLDLSGWELDLPIKDGSGMKIIKSPQLSSYSSQYFRWVGDACECWAPTSGAVSQHGGGPRSELRQNHEFGFSGSHKMELVTAVLQIPRESKKVVVAQIKGVSLDVHSASNPRSGAPLRDTVFEQDAVGGSCLITALVQYIGGTLQVQFIDKSCNAVVKPLGHYELGEKISLSLQTEDSKVEIVSDKGSASYEYSWVHSSYKQAFKAGVYDHGTSSSATDGGMTHLYKLSTSHSLDDGRQASYPEVTTVSGKITFYAAGDNCPPGGVWHAEVGQHTISCSGNCS